MTLAYYYLEAIMTKRRHRQRSKQKKHQNESNMQVAANPVQKSDYLTHASGSKGLLATCFSLLVAATKILPASAQVDRCTDGAPGFFTKFNETVYALFTTGTMEYYPDYNQWGPCDVSEDTRTIFLRTMEKINHYVCGNVSSTAFNLGDYVKVVADILISRGSGQYVQKDFEKCLEDLIEQERKQVAYEQYEVLIIMGYAVAAIAGTCVLGCGAYFLQKSIRSWLQTGTTSQVADSQSAALDEKSSLVHNRL
jgi:hypothetical protein